MDAHLYCGSWITTPSVKRFQLTPQPLAHVRVFQLGFSTHYDETQGAPPARFVVVADGERLSLPLHEGGQVLIEAKDLAIEQADDRVITAGTWEIVQEPKVQVLTSRWSAPSIPNETVLLANFKSETEAVIEFSGQGTPSSVERAYVRVMLDGKAMQASNGKPLLLAQGSSVLCRGKVFGLEVALTVPKQAELMGAFKLRAAVP